MPEYRKINDQYAFEEYQGGPYALAARTVAKSMNDWKRKNMKSEDTLEVFFEDGTKHKGDFLDVMQRDDLPRPIFLKKQTCPLQAADFFAWEAFNALKRGTIRSTFASILKWPGENGRYSMADLEEMCKAIPIPLRQDLQPGAKIVYKSLPKRPRKRTITLLSFRVYYNRYRTHSALEGQTPIKNPESKRAELKLYRWQAHCRGLYQSPIAA